MGRQFELQPVPNCIMSNRITFESEDKTKTGKPIWIEYQERTKALLCFTSFFLNKNCRLRFEMSMVSKSRSVILPKPVSTTFLTGEIARHKKELDSSTTENENHT
jgi:hypothetical protein